MLYRIGIYNRKFIIEIYFLVTFQKNSTLFNIFKTSLTL